jgi:hypothetical protein
MPRIKSFPKEYETGCRGVRVECYGEPDDYDCDYEFSGEIDCGDCVFGANNGKKDPRISHYEIVIVDKRAGGGRETRAFYSGTLADAVKIVGLDMRDLLEAMVSAHIVDERGVKVWDYARGIGK